MVRLAVHKVHVRPFLLDIQQNLCHCLGTVYLGLSQPQTIQIRTVENEDFHNSLTFSCKENHFNYLTLLAVNVRR